MKFTTKTDCTFLDCVLQLFHGISKQKAKKISNQYQILVNGNEVKFLPTTLVKAGTTLTFNRINKGATSEIKKQAGIKINILFEDRWFIAAEKPVGILSAGIKNERTLHFDKILSDYLTNRDEKKIKLSIIHRLDKEVGGIIIYAKNEEVKELLKNNWDEVEKQYLAITEKKLPEEKGEIVSWLFEGLKQTMVSSWTELPNSKLSKLFYEFDRKLGKYFLYKVFLHTGRKNQIRVQFAAVGAPIVGDWKYGADKTIIRQIRLASTGLKFNHPVTQKTIHLKFDVAAKFFKPSQTTDEKYK